MTWSRTINRNDINRARILRCRVALNPHGASKLLPRWAVDKSIVVPLAQVALVRRHSSAGRFHGGVCAEMLDDNVIPRVTILMAKDNKVSWHGRLGIRRFEPIAQLNGFAEGGFGEVDMVNVRSFAGSGN